MATKTFTVSHGSISLRVRVLETIKDVHRAYQSSPGGRARTGKGKFIPAFFLGTKNGKHTGTIFFPRDGRLQELVPHEVAHAVIHAFNGVLSHDDEDCCTAIGALCEKVFRGIKKLEAVWPT